MKTTETTQNITLDTAAIHTCGCIDFRALAKAYLVDTSMKLELHDVFVSAQKALYWMDMQERQSRGTCSDNIWFFNRCMSNRNDNWVELPGTIDDNIVKKAGFVMRRLCIISSALARRGMPRILTRCFLRDEKGFFREYDAITVVRNLDWAFEMNLGKSLKDINWTEEMEKVLKEVK